MEVVVLVAVGVMLLAAFAWIVTVVEELTLEVRRRRDLMAGVAGEGERLRRLGECTKRNG